MLNAYEQLGKIQKVKSTQNKFAKDFVLRHLVGVSYLSIVSTLSYSIQEDFWYSSCQLPVQSQ